MKLQFEGQKSESELAHLYVDACPPSIEKQGGDKQFFKVACRLFEKFSNAVAMEALEYYNQTKCQPPWVGKQLSNKIERALMSANQPNTFVGRGVGNFQNTYPKTYLPTCSPTPIPEDAGLTSKDLVLAAFKEEEIIYIAPLDNSEKQKPIVVDGKAKELAFTREELLALLGLESGDFYKVCGIPSNGSWMCINPMRDKSGKTDENVLDYRHLLVEFDSTAQTEQYSALIASKLPLVAIIKSGNKSIHGWVKVNAKNIEDFKLKSEIVYEFFSAFGIDKVNKNPSRYSRFGGQMRGDAKQEILALNVGTLNFDDWVEQREDIILESSLPSGKAFDEFERPLPDAKDEIIRHRFWCLGMSWTFIAPAGVGKSTWATAMGCHFVLGRNYLGYEVVRPQRVALIQAEDDEGDMGEFTYSVFKEMNILPDSKEQKLIHDNFITYWVRDRSGDKFIEACEFYIRKFKPTILIINPLSCFFGDDMVNQKAVSDFTNKLNQLMDRYHVAILLIHHTPKPLRLKEGEKESENIYNLTYAGLGHSSWANWTRASSVITITGKQGIFKLVSSKRGAKLRMKDEDGNNTQIRWIKHSKEDGVYFWKDCTPEDIEEIEKEEPNKGKRLTNFDKVREKIPFEPATITAAQIAVELQMDVNNVKKSLKSLIETEEVDEHPQEAPNRPKTYWRRRGLDKFKDGQGVYSKLKKR